MEKNQTDGHPVGMCRKIRKAIGAGSTHWSKHRISQRPQDPVAETVPSGFDRPRMPMAKPARGEASRVEGDTNQELDNINDKSSDYITRAKMKIRAMSNVGPKKAASNVGRDKGPSSSGTDHSTDNRFSEFINRAKMKMRTTSNVGHHGKNSAAAHQGKSSARSEHTSDKFSNYISRAKAKIRTTSGIGGGRNGSFK